MRLVVVAICVLLVWGPAPASAQEVHGGFKAGVNFANLDFTSQIAPNLDIHTGAVFGGFVELPIGAAVSIQPEVLFASKGASFEQSDAKISVHLRFVEIPVLATVGVVKHGSTTVHVFGGPSFGFRTTARVKAETAGFSDEQDIKDQVASLDFGIAFGAGVAVGHFVADGRYTFGLTNLNKDTPFDGSVYNRVFTVLAGVRF